MHIGIVLFLYGSLIVIIVGFVRIHSNPIITNSFFGQSCILFINIINSYKYFIWFHCCHDKYEVYYQPHYDLSIIRYSLRLTLVPMNSKFKDPHETEN